MHSFQWTYSTLILVVTNNSCISTCASDSTLFLNNFRWTTNPNIRKEDDGEFQKQCSTVLRTTLCAKRLLKYSM